MENKLQMTKGTTMNELQIFNNNQFGEIRTIEDNGKVLFCAVDIARALGYSNPHDAIGRHCRGVVKREGVSLWGCPVSGYPLPWMGVCFGPPSGGFHRLDQ